MKIVYRAENIIDANLVKGLLEQAGLKAFVNGSYLQGAVGELPASGLITVSVIEAEYPEAKRIVEEEEKARAGWQENEEQQSGPSFDGAIADA